MAIVAQAGREVRRQVGVDQRAECAAEAAGAVRMVYCFDDVGAMAKIALTVAPPSVAAPVTVAKRRRRRIELHHI